MKKFYTTIISAFVFLNVNAQAPSWVWANGAGGTGGESGSSTCTDASGNIYVTGSFNSPTIAFGSTTLTNAGNDDLFIVKYDALGNVQWAQGIGGIGRDNSRCIVADASGNIYVTGGYDSPTLSFGTTTITNVDTTDIFIAKFNPSGNLIWAKGIGGTDVETSYGAATDATGNLYITGYFKSIALPFGAISVINTDTSGTFSDLFVVKYNAAGNEVWAKREGCFNPDLIGTSYNYFGSDIGYSICTDVSGNVLVTGAFFTKMLIFGNDTLNAGSNATHTFVLKYDNAGNPLWARGETMTPYSGLGAGENITTDASGNVFVTGYFNDYYAIFGSDTVALHGNPGNPDVFIVKFDPSGNVLWLNGAGGNATDFGRGMVTDALGNVYLTGLYSIGIDFGSGVTLGNGASFDVYVVKYNAAGTAAWAIKAGSSWQDGGASIAMGLYNNLYVTGFYSAFMFLGSNTLSFGGGTDMFIAKLDALPVGINETNKLSEIGIYPNPSNGIFNCNQTIKTVEVYNMMGQLIITDNNTNQINLQTYPNGLYLAKLNGVNFCKLVKE